MSISPYVPLLLAVCWMLPAMAVAVWYRLSSPSAHARDRKPMRLSQKEVQAEIRQLDLDATKAGWRSEDWEGPEGNVRSQVRGLSHKVRLSTPYAEATVSVMTGGEKESRRCSLCLN